MNSPGNFQDRIKRNNDYYDAFAAKVKVRSEDRDFSRAFDEFLTHVKKERTILDIGCGAGNHLKVFNNRGHNCLGIEPSAEMRKLASEFGSVVDGTFENLLALDLPPVGGVWCASSLLHVPKEEVGFVFRSIGSLLPAGAPLYFTVRLGEGSKWDKWDDTAAEVSRFLQFFSREELLSGLEDSGFGQFNEWVEDSYWGRLSQWISIVALKK